MSEIGRRQAYSPWKRSGGSTDVDGGEEEPPQEEQEHLSVRSYLTDFDEVPADVKAIQEMLEDPSNIIGEDGSFSLLSWDIRESEPRGSYLYVLQQDLGNDIIQVHRYFCHERRLDILLEICRPVASVYSDSGRPMAVAYSEEGVPITFEAEGLDESLFSRSDSYVEANEYLYSLQEYLNSLRG